MIFCFKKKTQFFLQKFLRQKFLTQFFETAIFVFSVDLIYKCHKNNFLQNSQTFHNFINWHQCYKLTTSIILQTHVCKFVKFQCFTTSLIL